MAANRLRLNLEMEHYASSGMILSIEEQLLLKTSLPLLKMDNNISSVAFWGKVLGTEGDYYVAQGGGNDFIRNKMSFYSLDLQRWRFMFPPSVEDMMQFHLVRTRFTGDPTEYHHYMEPAVNIGESDTKKVMKEEDRLSTFVTLVDIEAAIAPKGAYVLNPKGRVIANEAFKGLSLAKALQLSSYVHLRLPKCDGDYIPAAVAPGPDRATNFLESIENDIPAGCWTLHIDEAEEVITLRNLWWPGFTFYNVLNDREFGKLYIGFGERTDDLPFMI